MIRCRKCPLKQDAVYQIPSTSLVRRSGPTFKTPTSPQTENKQLILGQVTNYVFHHFDAHYVGMEKAARGHSGEMMTYMWEVMTQDCRKVAPWVKPPEASLRGGKCLRWLGSTATTSFSQTLISVLLTLPAKQQISVFFIKH